MSEPDEWTKRELRERAEKKEREQREALQLLKLQRFHDRVARGAGIAFKVMLEQLAKDHDIRFVEPSKVEEIGRMSWAWGVSFAESAGDES